MSLIATELLFMDGKICVLLYLQAFIYKQVISIFLSFENKLFFHENIAHSAISNTEMEMNINLHTRTMLLYKITIIMPVTYPWVFIWQC